jgi:hypothetical protein
MKLFRIDLLLLLLVPFLSCDTKGDFEGDFTNYFIKYYGEDGAQEGVDLIVNEEEGTLLLLGTTRLPGGSSRILLVKTTADGTILWEKRLGGTAENAKDIEPTDDGNFFILSNMLLGTDLTTNENLYDFKVLKVTPEGNKLDSMVFGNNGGAWKTQFINSLTPLSDGGFIVTGNSTDEDIFVEPEGTLPTPPPEQEDLVALAFNSDLSFRWTTQSTPGEHFGSGIKVFEKNAGSYSWFSYSDKLSDDQNPSDNTYESNFNVFELTGTGGFIPAGSYAGGKIDDEVLKSVCRIPGGFYEIGTTSKLSVTTSGQLYFAKRTSDLALIEEGPIQGITGNFVAAAVTYSSSEGLLIAANEMGATGSTIRLIRTDLDNSAEWSVSFGSSSKTNIAATVAELPDGRILVLGTIELETQKKMALIKVNPQGEFLN